MMYILSILYLYIRIVYIVYIEFNDVDNDVQSDDRNVKELVVTYNL